MHFGVDVLVAIGMTETLHIFLSNRPDADTVDLVLAGNAARVYNLKRPA
jgi:hypothetical protein